MPVPWVPTIERSAELDKRFEPPFLYIFGRLSDHLEVSSGSHRERMQLETMLAWIREKDILIL